METAAEYRVAKSDIEMLPLSPNGMGLMVPSDIGYSKAQAVADHLMVTGDLSKWYLGDLFNAVENKEFYSQLLDATKKSSHTINNYKRVAENIRPNGRWPNVSWSHHERVAKLHPDDQEKYLRDTSEGNWSVSRLDEELKNAGLIETKEREKKPKVTSCPHCDQYVIEGEEPCPWCMLQVSDKRIEDLQAVLTEIANPSGDLEWAAELASRALKEV